MKSAEYKIELLRAVDDRLRQSRCSLSDLTIRSLNNMITVGLRKVKTSELDSENTRRKIASSLLRVIDAMIEEGNRRKLGGELDNLSFIRARNIMVPVWPFN